jgi:hypothetical protein
MGVIYKPCQIIMRRMRLLKRRNSSPIVENKQLYIIIGDMFPLETYLPSLGRFREF